MCPTCMRGQLRWEQVQARRQAVCPGYYAHWSAATEKCSGPATVVSITQFAWGDNVEFRQPRSVESRRGKRAASQMTAAEPRRGRGAVAAERGAGRRNSRGGGRASGPSSQMSGSDRSQCQAVVTAGRGGRRRVGGVRPAPVMQPVLAPSVSAMPRRGGLLIQVAVDAAVKRPDGSACEPQSFSMYSDIEALDILKSFCHANGIP